MSDLKNKIYPENVGRVFLLETLTVPIINAANFSWQSPNFMVSSRICMEDLGRS